MKSVVIQQPEKLVIEDRPIPQPQAGEVRVSVGIILSPSTHALLVMSFSALLMP